MSAPTPAPRWTFGGAALLLWLAITIMWWVLAFAPLPAPDPWVARLRSVCFGASADGLPDAQGWVLLVLGPASMLAFLFAVWGPEVRQLLTQSLANTRGRAIASIVAATLVAGLLYVGNRVALARGYGAVAASLSSGAANAPRLQQAMPSFALTDQRGNTVTAGDLAARPTLVTFAYAHCTTVCPVVVRTALTAWQQLQAQSRPTTARLVIVTLDPWRDTPSSLPGLARAWQLPDHRDVHVLSGSVDAVTAMLKAWNVPTARDAQSGDIAHPALVYVTDAAGRIAYAFTNPTPATLVDAAQRAANDARS